MSGPQKLYQILIGNSESVSRVVVASCALFRRNYLQAHHYSFCKVSESDTLTQANYLIIIKSLCPTQVSNVKNTFLPKKLYRSCLAEFQICLLLKRTLTTKIAANARSSDICFPLTTKPLQICIYVFMYQ